MQTYIKRGRLEVAQNLHDFLIEEAIPGSEVEVDAFWREFEKIVAELTPRNFALLTKRNELQSSIDQYCQQHQNINPNEYKSFLQQIGYLDADVEDFQITTQQVDEEIALMAGPQLVVPINNARYAINAANARWGSLYDALYGSDIIDEQQGAAKQGAYNPKRGQKVIDYAKRWLDIIAPLTRSSHAHVEKYNIYKGEIEVTLQNGSVASLQNPKQFVGFLGSTVHPHGILLRHNGLHVELQIDANSAIGKADPTGLKDILVESALTTIMDCEDSVAAVDAEDKTLVYRNWLGLMQGTLSTSLNKNGKTVERSLNPDRRYQGSDGNPVILAGRSLMFVRNVGHLMTNNAILFDGAPIYEGIMDAMITGLIAKHDLLGNSKYRNSKEGSIYIVKPKMHGSEEVAFANDLFAQVEQGLELPANTLKMGIMDEERRTSVNLKACIHAAKERVVFINTGFLDRTGDEIHTSMQLGPFAPKSELKQMPWITAYEKANVMTGLKCGLSGKAQIGKGMWPIPDNMADMMEAKIAHPRSGANTAWVPSPTAATLHALHYHQENVFNLREDMMSQSYNGLDEILQVPVVANLNHLNGEQIQQEVDNNVQGILGYVVRWVHQGIGCSKVPDIHNVGLMEDRATLRISSQHLANWLAHNVVTEQQVEESMLRMAELVDKQNLGDSDYIAMCPDPQSSLAYQAAWELIFKGKEQPSGYTEPVLHAKRQEMKLRLSEIKAKAS